jgi:hypothetical protein
MKNIENKKFWGKMIAYFHLIRHGLHIKQRLRQLFVVAGTSLPSFYLATTGGPRTDAQAHPSNNASVAARIHSRGNMFRLTTKRGIHFTKLLLSKDRRNKQTHRLMGFMNSATEMGPVAIIYVPSFIKLGSGIQKFIGGTHRNTESTVFS